MARFTYGGQALIEGVLMRGRSAVAVALRHPDGSIVTATERLDGPLHRSRYGRLPLVRGLVVLYDTLVVGFRWLSRSASVAASAEGVELGRGAMAVTILFALALGIGLFLVLPLFLAQFSARGPLSGLLGPLIGGNLVAEHLLEGFLRLVIFVLYLLLISRAPDIRRVFAYHGAEHMTIHALEHEDPLVPSAVRRYPTAHPRCGTEFILVVVVVSIFAFSLLAGQDLVVSILGRVALVPVIAAVSYELLRFGARNRSNPLVRWVFMPGIWLQMITTRQPEEDMIEVAIAAMRGAVAADGEEVPEGSLEPETRPLVLPGRPAEGGPVPVSADPAAADPLTVDPMPADPVPVDGASLPEGER
jgi:uncharacterized protein YqhQ